MATASIIDGAVSYFRRNRVNILLLVASSAACFLFMEAVFRYVVPVYGDPPDLHIPDDRYIFRMRPNFTGYYIGGEHGRILIQTNSAGYRDVEHTLEKPAGTYRIVGLGDSVTVGSGVYYNETYLAVLEDTLNSRGGRRFEVVKTAVGSWEFEQEYELLVEEGLRYDPDMVVYGLCLNDILVHDMKKLRDYRFGGGLADPMFYLRFVQRNCYSCNFIWNAVRYSPLLHDREKHDREYLRYVFSEWDAHGGEFLKKRVMKLVNLTRERNIKLVIVVFPFSNQFGEDQYTYPQQLLRNFSAEHNVTVIDMLPYLKAQGGVGELYLPGDITHFKSRGHAAVAEALAEEVLKETR